jgi:hypothetical protein
MNQIKSCFVSQQVANGMHIYRYVFLNVQVILTNDAESMQLLVAIYEPKPGLQEHRLLTSTIDAANSLDRHVDAL